MWCGLGWPLLAEPEQIFQKPGSPESELGLS